MSDAEFPKRPIQHVSEDTSITVFKEGLPKEWIFRDQGTRNDYGIDAEVELVAPDGRLHGHLAKVQLKGREHIEFDADGVASISGIRQPTMRYWLGLSRYANVIVAVTDNAARASYFTPVFWQAATALDGTDETRSVRVSRDWSMKSEQGPSLFALSVVERPWDEVRAHEELLRGLARTLHDFLWVFQADPWMVHRQPETAQRWLRLGRQILGPLLKDEHERLFDFAHWLAKSEKDWGDSPMYGTLRSTYIETFALVFPTMQAVSARVKKASYFFEREAPEYLQLVEQTALPERVDYDGIAKFVEDEKIEEPR